MNAEFELVELALDRPFGISRGTVAMTENVIVRLEYDGETGLGGAAPSRYYGETPETVGAVLPALLEVVEDVGDPFARQRIEKRVDGVVGGNPAAKAAVDIALTDLASTLAGLPLYRYLGLDPKRVPTSSYTISLADTPRMRRWAEEATRAGYDVLKVKLGGAQDVKALEAVREAAPEATIRVDANGAWTRHEAVRMCTIAADLDAELVEQPTPAGDPDALAFVRERSPVPIAADEACVGPPDIPRVADAVDAVVVKLMKSGGVRAALRTIHAARAHGLEVMLGCMLETNTSIAAAAHLAPLADYADLDGSLLLADDPYRGIPMTDGEIELADVSLPGTGARERHEAVDE